MSDNKKNFKGKSGLYYLIAIIAVLFGGTSIVGTEFSNEIPQAVVSESQQTESQVVQEVPQIQEVTYSFRNEKLLNDHFEKHGIEMGFDSAESYEAAANEVINHPDTLHRIEEEDGDDVYYLEETNGFVIVSIDGYIRTFFYPDDGLEYFNRQ